MDMQRTRVCNTCSQQKPLGKFPLGGYRKDGSEHRRRICKACVRLQTPIPYKARRIFVKNNPRPELHKEFKCPICTRILLPETNRQVCLDHDHKTGEIRGWVCNDCNSGMGKLRESPEVLRRAIVWLGCKKF